MNARTSLGALALLMTALLPVTVTAQSPAPEPSPLSPAPGCDADLTPSAGPTGDAGRADLTVFAAASLRAPFEGLAQPWAAAHPGSDLILSFDSSSALRAQIEEAAPADVFASADMANPQRLVDPPACLAIGPVTPFAGNTLVIVVPGGNPAGITSPADLARPGVRVIAALPDVPITGYARQLQENFAALPGYPVDYLAAVAANTVSQEENVKAVLAKIELGEGDAAIVYVTDATSSSAVETIAIPVEANVPVTYGAVLVRATPNRAMANAFLGFLAAPAAQEVLAEAGFLPPPGP